MRCVALAGWKRGCVLDTCQVCVRVCKWQLHYFLEAEPATKLGCGSASVFGQKVEVSREGKGATHIPMHSIIHQSYQSPCSVPESRPFRPVSLSCRLLPHPSHPSCSQQHQQYNHQDRRRLALASNCTKGAFDFRWIRHPPLVAFLIGRSN